MPVDWERVKRCPIWPVLGVTECNGCPSCKDCWGEETELPEIDDRVIQEIFNAVKKEG